MPSSLANRIGYTLHKWSKRKQGQIQYSIIHESFTQILATKQLKKKNTEHWNLSISKRSRISNHDNQAHLAKSSFTYRIEIEFESSTSSQSFSLMKRERPLLNKNNNFSWTISCTIAVRVDSFLNRFLTWFKRVWYIPMGPSAAWIFNGSRVITSWISQKKKKRNIDW